MSWVPSKSSSIPNQLKIRKTVRLFAQEIFGKKLLSGQLYFYFILQSRKLCIVLLNLGRETLEPRDHTALALFFCPSCRIVLICRPWMRVEKNSAKRTRKVVCWIKRRRTEGTGKAPLTLVLHVRITSDRKSVIHTAEYLEVIHLLLLNELIFNFTTRLFGERAVGFSAGKEHRN